MILLHELKNSRATDRDEMSKDFRGPERRILHGNRSFKHVDQRTGNLGTSVRLRIRRREQANATREEEEAEKENQKSERKRSPPP